MLLPEEALIEIAKFQETTILYGADDKYKDIQFGKGKRNYDKICTKLKNINPELVDYSTCQTISLEELKEYMLKYLPEIYGSNYQKRVQELNGMLYPHKMSTPFDAAIEQNYQNDNYETNAIHINRKPLSIQILSTAHEYVHDFLTPYTTTKFNSVISSYHYDELLSILTEYIILSKIKNNFQENLTLLHEMTRIKANHDHVEEVEATYELERQGAVLHEMIEYFDYARHNAYKYIISDIYATKLAECYQLDTVTFLKELRKVIQGLSSIDNLLNYYNVNLKEPSVIYPYLDKIDRVGPVLAKKDKNK